MRHVFHALETTVMDLLLAADVVKVDDAHVSRVVEIALSGVDEGQMAVLSDAQRNQHRRPVGQKALVAVGLCVEIGRIAGQFVEGCEGHAIRQALAQKAAEGGGVAGGQSGIFIEMEGRDAGPVDGRVGAQSGEEFVLGRRGGEDYRGAAVLLDGGADDGGRFRRGGHAGFLAGGVDGHSLTHSKNGMPSGMPHATVVGVKMRRDREPPPAVARDGWRYHHIGVPTTVARPGEIYLPGLKMFVSGFESSPYGVQWMRFEEDSPFPEVIKTVPHVAFEVGDLTAALVGKEVLVAPNCPAEGVRVAMIVSDDAPAELLEFVGQDFSLRQASTRRLASDVRASAGGLKSAAG